MRRYLIALFYSLFLLTLISCNERKAQELSHEEKGKRPEVVLSKEKMREVLKDIQLMEAYENLVALENLDSLGNRYRKDAFFKILEKHDIEERTFIDNLEYYQYNKRMKLIDIYEEIELELGQTQTQTDKTGS